MKRPGYREAVRWIAYNDDQDLGFDGGFLVSIMMVADLFGKEPEDVAKAVQRVRDKEDE